MSARKKRSSEAAAAEPDAKAFTVVLEDLRSRFQVFGEALQGLREHMDARFMQVDVQFAQVDARFAIVDHQLGLVKSVLLEHGRDLRDIRHSVERLETKLDEKVDRAEVLNIVETALSKRRQSPG